MVFVGEYFEERGLSAAVASDESDFLSSRHGKSDAIEKSLMPVGEADFVCGEKCHERGLRNRPGR